MSARKLQQEIDKVNKKISEGLAIFDDTYEKLFATELSTQRDKFEADLKKEIKKLQRLRDQVKQWLGDSSIKLDKKVLQENRSKIEHAMDQFKDLEKISKIKQFSNEGLELLSKSGKIKRFGDSNDVKKQEACEYISDVIEKLSAQNEILEGEIHQYATQLKKAKASNAYSIQTSLDEVKEKHDQIDNHLGKLESVLRSLENEILKPDQVDSIKDDLDYIVESNQDDDFIDYDDFYDILNLEEIEFNAFNKEELDRKEKEEKEEQERLEKEQKEKEQKEKEQKEKEQREKEKKEKELKEKEEAEKKKSKVSTPITQSSTLKKAIVNSNIPPPLPAGSYSSVLKNALNESNTSQSGSSTGTTTAQSVPNVYESGKTIAETVANSTASSSTMNASPGPTVANGNNSTEMKAPLPPGLNGLSRVNTAKSSTASPISANIPIPQTESIESYETKTFLDNIPRLSQISEHRLNNPLSFKSISSLLQNSLYNCPDSFDAEKPRQYNPKTVHPSSIDYPQEPMLELQSKNIMKKFNDDTLFYCFYYSDGIYNLSRYNAAVELSNRGWVFNKETCQWFLQDNKSDDLKYFDYQETWLVRRKDIKLNEQIVQRFM